LNIAEILQRVEQVINSKANKDVAKALRCEPSTVSNWKVRGTIPLDELHIFAKSKGVSLEWLLTGDKLEQERETLKNIKFYEQKRRATDIYKLKLAREKNIDLDADMETIFSNGNELVKDYIAEVINFLASKVRNTRPTSRRTRKIK